MDNMPIVFCEMMRTMGVSGAMAVSRVQSTCYNEPILRVRDHRYQWAHVMPESCHTSAIVIQRHDHTYSQVWAVSSLQILGDFLGE